jgi:hypothetical protein
MLCSCSAKSECDSSETHLAVLQTLSDDHNNALVKYAAKNSNMANSSDASWEAEKSKERRHPKIAACYSQRVTN